MSDFLHYQGLSAETYDLHLQLQSRGLEDEAFYRSRIEASGGTTLEMACGTGRLLLPYLEAGFDVEGLDASPEMLDICRRKAEAMGLEPVLHEGFMQEMDLGRKYRTIYVPFCSFMVLTDRETVWDVLRRVREHLEDGGQFFVSTFFPSYSITAAQTGLWKKDWEVEREDGSVVIRSESVTNDLVEQVKTIRFRYELFRDGVLERTELQEFQMRWYFKYEFALMLEKAGFRDVFVHGDYTDEEVRDGHGGMVFRAVR